MHHLIYIAGTQPVTATTLAERGLGGDAEGAVFAPLPEDLSPRDPITGERCGEGTAVGWPHDDRPVDWCFDARDWTASTDRGDGSPPYFVGVHSERKPRPTDLLRDKPIDGSPVKLGDGNLWIVPRLDRLPLRMYLADGGVWDRCVPPDLAAYWHCATAFRARAASGDPELIEDFDAAGDLLLESLRVNYRLPAELVGRLGLLTTGPRGTLEAALKATLFGGPPLAGAEASS